MRITLLTTGRAIFVDASCLDECHPMEALRNATFRALLDGVEPSDFIVIDEEWFYDTSGIEHRVYRPSERAEYTPQRESEDVYFCCALWETDSGILLALNDGCEMAARADELFPPEYTPADALRAAAKKIDIGR